MSCVCNWNQSSGAKFFGARPPHAAPALYFHQEVIQLTTWPPDLSSADSFRGIKPNGFWPFIMPSKRYPQYNPYMPDCFIWVPATWITWRMQPVSMSTNISLNTHLFIFYGFECPLYKNPSNTWLSVKMKSLPFSNFLSLASSSTCTVRLVPSLQL